MLSSQPKIIRKVGIRLLPMDVAARHHSQMFRSLALLAALIYLARGCLAFGFGMMPTAFLLIAVAVIHLGIYALAKKTEIVKSLTLALSIIILASEAWLVETGVSHFVQFLLVVPLCIILVALLIGMLPASIIALVSSGIGVYMVHAHHALAPNSFILSQEELFRWRFLLYLVISELLIVFVVYQFQSILAKSEEDMREIRSKKARSSRRVALAETIGKAAHELNNPLAILDGAFRRFKFYVSREDHGQQAKNLGFMQDALKRLRGVLENIRIFVEGDLEEPLSRITSDELIQTFMQNSREKLLSYGTKLEISNQLPQEFIQCRPRQIQFVLQVLLENAIESGKAESIIVRLRIQGMNTRVRIELEDNGEGIRLEDTERIFTPFFTTKAVGKTIGMNLSISRVLIEEQGGTIGFQSVPKGGTMFYVSLKRG